MQCSCSTHDPVSIQILSPFSLTDEIEKIGYLFGLDIFPSSLKYLLLQRSVISLDSPAAGIADEKFDAVSFTSAPAVASVLMRATEMGIEGRNKVLARFTKEIVTGIYLDKLNTLQKPQ